SKPAGLRIVLTGIACGWRSFWPSGGPCTWQPPVFITGNASALIASIGQTRGSFGWDGSGSERFCVAHAIAPLYGGVYPCNTPRRAGALPCASNTQDGGRRGLADHGEGSFTSQAEVPSQEMCLGERARPTWCSPSSTVPISWCI